MRRGGGRLAIGMKKVEGGEGKWRKAKKKTVKDMRTESKTLKEEILGNEMKENMLFLMWNEQWSDHWQVKWHNKCLTSKTLKKTWLKCFKRNFPGIIPFLW